jgi:hypothetical protein
MQISRELLNAHKAKLLGDRDQLRSALDATIGGVAQVDHLLAVLDLPEPAPGQDASSEPAAQPEAPLRRPGKPVAPPVPEPGKV